MATETVKIQGGGDGILIAGGVIIFFVIILLVVWALNPDIFKKKEGDDCEVDDGDIRGTYKIDKDGKCVLKSCDPGWKIIGNKCSKDPTPAPADPTPAPMTSDKFRYVRFAKTNDITIWSDRIINLGEVYVYDSSGTNVALGKTVMHDSTTTPYYKELGKNLVDGDDFSMATSGDHVKQNDNQPQKQWIQIDLGSEVEVSSIKVIDRPGYPSRLNDVKIQLLDGSNNVLHTSPALTTNDAKKGISHTYTVKTKKWTHAKGPTAPADPTPGPADPTPGPADPCAGVTDATATTDVSKECLKKTLISFGCKPDSGLVTGITIDGGWGGGGGTFGGAKSDMQAWATLTTPEHRMGCYGVSSLPGDPTPGPTDPTPGPTDPTPGPVDPCAGVGDDYLIGNIKSKCIRKTILDIGCVSDGSLLQNFPDNDATGLALGTVGNFGELKTYVRDYYFNSKIGTDPREACYGSKGVKFVGSWIDNNSFRVKFPDSGMANFITKGSALLTDPTKSVGNQWRLAWVADTNRDQLLWLDSNGTQYWALPDQSKKDEMGTLDLVQLTSDGNIATHSSTKDQWHNQFSSSPKPSTHPSGQHMLVGRTNGDLYIDHGDNTRTFIYGPKNADEYTAAATPADSGDSSSTPTPGAAGVGGLGSDKRLKDDITLIGKHRGYNVYRWVWNSIAMSTYGYTGSEIGFLADELEPKYIGTDVYGYKYLKEGTPVVKYLQEVRTGNVLE